MSSKWSCVLLLSSLLFLTLSNKGIAMEEDSRDEVIHPKVYRISWDEIIRMRVPRAPLQLQNYKEIYGKHLNEGRTLKEPVEGLETHLYRGYAVAYWRLKELEGKDSTIGEKLGQAPTSALKRLFTEHTQDITTGLSVNNFKEKVLTSVLDKRV